jgi:hypothetical protein
MEFNSNYKYDKRLGYEFNVCIDDKNVKEYEGRDGARYIEGRRGSEFTLKFRNKTSDRVLVVMSIDGLSVMDGKPAGKNSGGYICGSWETIEIPGWKLDSNKVAKFEFQPQGDRKSKTYVEELAAEGFDVDTANQGVIGIMVFREMPLPPSTSTVVYHHHYHPNKPWDTPWWYTTNAYPLNDSGCGQMSNMSITAGNLGYSTNTVRGINQLQSANFSNVVGSNSFMAMEASCDTEEYTSATADVSLGTGFGDEEKFKTRQIEFKRQEIPVWTDCIFYDTRSNLQKKGIVFDTYVRKGPNAFPSMNEGCYVPKSRR